MKPEVVQHYEVVPGLLFAGEYPASWEPELAGRRLATVLARGVRRFIDLTTPQDPLEPYEPLLAGTDAVRCPFPIPDMGVPRERGVMRAALAAIREGIGSGGAVYVHCWGGIGRTGTVIGCLFREEGLDGDEALERVQSLYAAGMPKVRIHARSPQTRAQCDYVRNWSR